MLHRGGWGGGFTEGGGVEASDEGKVQYKEDGPLV